MRVSAVQFKPGKYSQIDVLADLAALAGDAASDADLVVLPELATTGYLFLSADLARPFAEPASGATFAALSAIARSQRCWIVSGFMEDGGEALYNSALVIDDKGDLAFVYRKTRLFPADEWWAAPGNSGYRAFTTAAGKFGVGICMDLNDDGFTAWCRDSALDAIAFPTNWLDEGDDVHAYWRERLTGIGSALVAANTYGPEVPIKFSGRSAIIQSGRTLVEAPLTGDAVIRAVVEAGRVYPPSP